MFGLAKKRDIDIDKFRSYLRNDKGKTIREYLKKIGINNIIHKPYLTQIIDAIILYVDDNYLEELFNDDEILNLFIEGDRCDFSMFENFSIDTCKKVLDRLLEIDDDTYNIVILFKCFSQEVQEELLFLLRDRVDVLLKIVEVSSFKLTSIMLNNDMLDLVSVPIDIETLFKNGKDDYLDGLRDKYETGVNNKMYSLSPLLLTPEFNEKLWNSYSIFRIRSIINDSIYITNSSIINDYIKTMEDEAIIGSLKTSLLPLYQGLYDKYLIQLEINGLSCDSDYSNYFNKIYQMNNRLRNTLTPLEEGIYKELDTNLITDKDILFKFIKELNDEAVSNYIIDFHFEENYYNIILDIKELVNFNDRGNIKLDETHLRLYRLILDIDDLDLENKVKLHMELKKYNMMEMLYDDMLEARRIIGRDIKDKALNKDNIKKYYDKDLSNKYGVNIYVIDDTELCALAKSDEKFKNNIPTGYSYSLVGNDVLGTYKPFQVENFIYDSSYLNPDQIVHIYPEDSYTTPAIYGSDEASSARVNKLLMPSELLKYDSDYNELLILEKGSIEVPIDKDIPSLPKLGVYCYDYNLLPFTVDYAKTKGLDVICSIRTKSDRKIKGIQTTHDDVNNIYYTELLSNVYNEERRKNLKLG